VSKDCLKWSGANIRFELFDRFTGFLILQTRLSYFKMMFNRGWQAFNPEQFDLSHVQRLHGKVCEADSMELPLTVARLKDNHYCFERDEIFAGQKEQCYPSNQRDFIWGNFCKVK
jgi:hypothetical protein